MNAFVFANTQDPKQQIKATNASFLPLEGRPLLIYVLMALDRVTQIEKVVVIGSRKEVMRAIESVIFEIPFQKKIMVVEEKESFLDSVLFAEAETRKTGERQAGLAMISEPALYLPGNIPFVTTAEITSFIAASGTTEADCFLSITPRDLSSFPGANSQESDLNDTATEALRPGRLMLARADAIGDSDGIKIIENTYKKTQAEAEGLSAQQLEAFLKDIGASLPIKPSETNTAFSKIEEKISTLLKTRFKFIKTTTSGNALPAESEASYQFLINHFEDWRKHIMTLKTEEGDKICSISGTACDSHDDDAHKH